ncbi:unnamed protein product [Phytomonas sp. Hart1]|nr:unnamed protein product [Phytomonas sp. Hart1]|eukprot:CCW70178.1 unnamed protein product [Phytomonas sp. isolate Hart1]
MLQVNTIGTIHHSPAFVRIYSYVPILLPVGYEVERPVFCPPKEPDAKRGTTAHVIFASSQDDRRNPDTANGHVCEDLFFTATIGQSPGDSPTPVFTITRSDDPVRKRYTAEGAITRVWRMACNEALRDFADRAAELNFPGLLKGKLHFHGIPLSGLSLKNVLGAVRALPGAEAALKAFGPAPSVKADPKEEGRTDPPPIPSLKGEGGGGRGRRARTRVYGAGSPGPRFAP